jgi:hypothetical protein
LTPAGFDRTTIIPDRAYWKGATILRKGISSAGQIVSTGASLADVTAAVMLGKAKNQPVGVWDESRENDPRRVPCTKASGRRTPWELRARDAVIL